MQVPAKVVSRARVKCQLWGTLLAASRERKKPKIQGTPVLLGVTAGVPKKKGDVAWKVFSTQK